VGIFLKKKRTTKNIWAILITSAHGVLLRLLILSIKTQFPHLYPSRAAIFSPHQGVATGRSNSRAIRTMCTPVPPRCFELIAPTVIDIILSKPDTHGQIPMRQGNHSLRSIDAAQCPPSHTLHVLLSGRERKKPCAPGELGQFR